MNNFSNKNSARKIIGTVLGAGLLGFVAHSALAELSTKSTTTTIAVAPVTAISNTVTPETENAPTVRTFSSAETKEKETEKSISSQTSVAPTYKQAKSKVTLEDKDNGDKVSGNTKVSVKIEEKENIAAVEVNLTRKDGGESLYIGKVLVDPVDTQGVVSWDSVNTPDGSYELTTLITKQNGEVVQGDSVAVVVKNEEEKWVKTKDTTSLGNSSVREVSRQFVAESFIEDIKSTHVVKEEQIKKEITNTLKTFSEEKEKKEAVKNIAKETVPLKTDAKDDTRKVPAQSQKLSTDFEKVVNEKAQELKEAVKKGDNEKKREIVTEIVNATQATPVGATMADNIPQTGIAQDALVKNIEEGVAKLEQVAIEEQSGIVDIKNFAVEEVAVTEVAAKPDGTKTASKISFKGKAFPNSFATLYIFSIPIVVTVKTDNDGNWNYTLDKELENGEHKVFVAITDGGGRILAKSEPLPFVKVAQAVTVGKVELALPVIEQEPGFFSGMSLYAFITIIIGIVGFGFLIMGIMVRSRPEGDSTTSS